MPCSGLCVACISVLQVIFSPGSGLVQLKGSIVAGAYRILEATCKNIGI
jgi:hypothetical protein